MERKFIIEGLRYCVHRGHIMSSGMSAGTVRVWDFQRVFITRRRQLNQGLGVFIWFGRLREHV